MYIIATYAVLHVGILFHSYEGTHILRVLALKKSFFIRAYLKMT